MLWRIMSFSLLSIKDKSVSLHKSLKQVILWCPQGLPVFRNSSICESLSFVSLCPFLHRVLSFNVSFLSFCTSVPYLIRWHILPSVLWNWIEGLLKFVPENIVSMALDETNDYWIRLFLNVTINGNSSIIKTSGLGQ